MNCAECEPLIGPLADGELDSSLEIAAKAHVADCLACGNKFVAIRELGNAVRELPVNPPPAELWRKISQQISHPKNVRRIAFPNLNWHVRVASVAALILIAFYTGWLAYGPGSRVVDPSESEFVDLAPILENGISVKLSVPAEFKFVASPLERAEQQAGFRVFSDHNLAEGYKAQQCTVGCCGMHSIVQTEYCRNKEKCLMIQHPPGVRVSFGASPTETLQIGDKSICVVKGKACWAASWPINGTKVTIVGLRDRDELLRMVAMVEKSLKGT